MNWIHKISHISERLSREIGLNRDIIKGKDNHIVNHSSRANVTLRIKGNGNCVQIGHNVRLSNLDITLYGNNHRLIIEDNCLIERGMIVIENSQGELCIGKDTTISGAAFSVSESGSRINVGRDCMFSNGIRIRTGDAHSVIDLETGKRTNFAKNIMIGDHVWIGAGAFILKGVEIGECAIIGAGAVVTKSVPANCIAAGNPARIVRKNITWTRERTPRDQAMEQNASTLQLD